MNVTLPTKTLNNGSYHLYFLLLKPETDISKPVKSSSVISEAHSLITRYSLPKTEAFNLIGSNSSNQNASEGQQVVTHLQSKVTLSVMSDDVSFSRYSVPVEIHPLLRIDERSYSYLPLLIIDKFSFRLENLVVSGYISS